MMLSYQGTIVGLNKNILIIYPSMAEQLFCEESFYEFPVEDPDSKTVAGSYSQWSRSSSSAARSGKLLDIATDPEALTTEQLSLQHPQPYNESVAVPELENDLTTGDLSMVSSFGLLALWATSRLVQYFFCKG